MAEQVAKFQSCEVNLLCDNLSGEKTVQIGGTNTKITTRNTNNADWQTRSTQYVYEYLHSPGLQVSYHTRQGTKRNVVAEKAGTTQASEIVLITAHLDDIPSSAYLTGFSIRLNNTSLNGVSCRLTKSGTFPIPKTARSNSLRPPGSPAYFSAT